jgi:acetyl esterase/lipase
MDVQIQSFAECNEGAAKAWTILPFLGRPCRAFTRPAAAPMAGPVFLSHGEADRVWTLECNRRLETRLREAGRTPEVYYYPDEGHGFQAAVLNIEPQRLGMFFQKRLETS